MINGFPGIFLDLLNNLVDLVGRRGGLLGKSPDFISDNGKRTSMLTGLGSDNRGIQRQQAGLLGQFRHHRGDGTDLFALGRKIRDDSFSLFNSSNNTLHTIKNLLDRLDTMLSTFLDCLRHSLGTNTALLHGTDRVLDLCHRRY